MEKCFLYHPSLWWHWCLLVHSVHHQLLGLVVFEGFTQNLAKYYILGFRYYHDISRYTKTDVMCFCFSQLMHTMEVKPVG